MVGICTGILVIFLLHQTRPVFAPVAYALFIIAIVWPMHRAACSPRLPRLLALAVVILAVGVAHSSLCSAR